MSGTEYRDDADLAAKLSSLEERMETKQAEYKTDVAHLKADFAHLKADFGSQFAGLEKAIARSEKENAERSFRQLLATAALVGGAVAILGILIRF